MQDYRKLFVWQKAHKLALDVYADSAKYLAHRPTWELRGQGSWRRDFSAIEHCRGIRPRQQFGLPPVLLLLVGIGQRT